jgi:hypothetical protein
MKPLAIPIAISLLAFSGVATAQSSYEGAGETAELDCGGGTATITGASNTMTVTGWCKELVIEGASNRVQVELAPKGVIRIVGAGNQVRWTTPDGSKAQLRVTGAGNRVSLAR